MTKRKVSKQRLLTGFNDMCKAMGKVSCGFDIKAIDGAGQWAMEHKPRYGWMIVSGIGGCGAAMGRWDGYVSGRWNFLMLIEALEIAAACHIVTGWTT